MPAGPRVLLRNVFYHVITRGNQQQQIFFGVDDYRCYLNILRKNKKRHGFLLYGYCLMPNHIHLLGDPVEPKKLSKFMQSVCRSYTGIFNKKYNKVGHLWQGRFKSKIIGKNDYLLDCISYIENNPVRAGIAKSAIDYQWSSAKERMLKVTSRGKMLDDLRL